MVSSAPSAPAPVRGVGSRGARKLCLFVSLAAVTVAANLALMRRQISPSVAGSEAEAAAKAGWTEAGLPWSSPPAGAPGAAKDSIASRDGRALAGSRRGGGNATNPAGKSATPLLNGAVAGSRWGGGNATKAAGAGTSATPLLNGTAVIQLLGELGNNLYILAFYYGVKTIAREEFGLVLTLHVRKQRNSKAEGAAKDAQCLKNFREVDFDECHWDKGHVHKRGRVCEAKIDHQRKALYELYQATRNETVKDLATCLSMPGETPDEIRAFLTKYVAMLTDDSILDLYRRTNAGWTVLEPYPFLHTESGHSGRRHASERLLGYAYGRGLADYFAFDEEATEPIAASKGRETSGDMCCADVPDEDEHVFHYRMFMMDLPKSHLKWGGGELTPPNAAGMLASAGLGNGTKVAVVAGRATTDRAEAYAKAFRNKSFKVRVIAGQTSIQDFCFLAHARAGLWGTAKSTYVQWASYINPRLRSATLYRANYPARKENFTEWSSSNADLARIMRQPVLNLSDGDVW
ncbi:hypothetical protein ACHAWF_007857 [Thalassiosira exigua]